MAIFSVLVAGKNATTTAVCLEKIPFDRSGPFLWFRGRDSIEIVLKNAGIGCYKGKSRSIYELSNSDINLRTCSTDDLESIYGIGPKTSRMFLLHTRPNQRVAALDLHVLRYLRDQGYDAPATTPTGRRYKILEDAFIRLADWAGKSVAEMDLEVWRLYSGRTIDPETTLPAISGPS